MRVHVEVGPLRVMACSYATAETPPFFGWNRYGGRTIGAYFRNGPQRVFSLVWREP